MRFIELSRRANGARRQPAKNQLSDARPFRGELLECRLLLAVDVTPTFTVTEDWTSGFQGELRLTNHENTAFTPWRLEFDWSANITSIWNAEVESRVGNRYTIVGAPWNTTLPAAGSIQFGFVASPGGSPLPPTNFRINGNTLAPVGPQQPGISIGDATLLEGHTGSRNALLTVRLSQPAVTPVSVAWHTTAGTAQAGSDFRAASGTVWFHAGQTAQLIAVPILGDRDFEPDETLYVDLSQPVGATLQTSRGTITILNDDSAALPAAEFQVISNWGAGYTGQILVRNTTSAPVTDWRVEFQYAGTIQSIWNATLESRHGSRYVLRAAGNNQSIPPGGTTTLGLVGTPAGVWPTNLAVYVNGQQPVNRAPLAAHDTALTTLGNSVLIDVLANDSDPDGDAIELLAATGAAHGTVSVVGSQVRYSPAAGFVGSDSFSYQIRDERGASATGTVQVTVSDVTLSPRRMFAPYVDMGLWPTYDLVSAARDQGIQYFTLAFITADPQNRPAWGGYAAYALGSDFDAGVRAQIAGVRALGGDVIVSFGGAVNRELAEVLTDPAALQAAYQSIIDAYDLKYVDFDIEGGAIAHRDSVDRRNVAIAGLQQAAAAAGRELVVSFTLPVLPSGLTPDGVYLLQSAVARGVNIGVANIMAMDYGSWAAPNPQGRMGDYAIEAATSLFNQLKTVYGTSKTDAELWPLVGITPMIGVNDVTTEIFDQQEAREVLAFAQQQGIGRLSFWSLNRDRQHANGVLGHVDLMSSSILQTPFEFSQIFNPFDD